MRILILTAIFNIIIKSLLITVLSIVILGIGKIITLIFPSLTLFQASLFPLVISFIYVIFEGAIEISRSIKSKSDLDSYLFSDLLEEEEEDHEEDRFGKEISDSYYDNKITPLKKDINLNAPCPCGSGKKYKNCCNKKNKNYEE